MSTRFDILATPISGLRILQRKPLGDDRGYLERLFCTEELQAAPVRQAHRPDQPHA